VAARSRKRLAGRIALITGASRGIGAAVARRFAAEGASTILLARTVGGLEDVDDQIREDARERGDDPPHGAMLVPLDLHQPEAIDQLGAALYERFGRLDVLVGNAAMLGQLGPIPHQPPALWDEVIAINLTANYRLIRSMDPLLRQSEAGRAIFVTSGVAHGTFPYWGPYAVSKAALEALVRTYAGEIAKTKMRANIVDPGVVRTRMRAQAFPGEEPESLPLPDAITDAFVRAAEASFTANGTVIEATADG
jgi:NAD(P)-dependent dehydrogenase (short-subunit alcohol dehydrogenase family)